MKLLELVSYRKRISEMKFEENLRIKLLFLEVWNGPDAKKQ